MKKENKAISRKEIAWYIIAGFIAILGVVSIVFGVIGHHMGGDLSSNFIKQAETKTGLGFRAWGIIAVALGAIIAIITLSVFAKEYDRNIEKTIRRQQRVVNVNTDMEIRPAVQTIEVESMVKPATEETPEAKEQ